MLIRLRSCVSILVVARLLACGKSTAPPSPAEQPLAAPHASAAASADALPDAAAGIGTANPYGERFPPLRIDVRMIQIAAAADARAQASLPAANRPTRPPHVAVPTLERVSTDVKELLAPLPVDGVRVEHRDGAIVLEGIPTRARLRLLAGARFAVINKVFEPVRGELQSLTSNDVRVDPHGNSTIWARGADRAARAALQPWLARLRLPADHEVIFVETFYGRDKSGVAAHLAFSKAFATGALLRGIAIGKNGHHDDGAPALVADVAGDLSGLFDEVRDDNTWAYLVLGDRVLWLNHAATLHPTMSLDTPPNLGTRWWGSTLQLADWDADPEVFTEERAAALARRLRAADLLERAIASWEDTKAAARP